MGNAERLAQCSRCGPVLPVFHQQTEHPQAGFLGQRTKSNDSIFFIHMSRLMDQWKFVKASTTMPVGWTSINNYESVPLTWEPPMLTQCGRYLSDGYRTQDTMPSMEAQNWEGLMSMCLHADQVGCLVLVAKRPSLEVPQRLQTSVAAHSDFQSRCSRQWFRSVLLAQPDVVSRETEGRTRQPDVECPPHT